MFKQGLHKNFLKWGIVRVKLSVFALIFFCNVQAQISADAQAKMQQAQRMLDSVKKLHPEIANQLNSMSNMMNQQQGKMQQAIQQVPTPAMNATGNIQLSLPIPSKGYDASKIPIATEADIKNYAQGMLSAASAKLDAITKQQLDKMVASTNINLAGTGMMMMGAGMPKFVGIYLVCNDFLKQPKIPWTINDLAILIKDDGEFGKAISCFKYAETLQPNSLVIKANLGWSTAYYGDFRMAKSYFDSALLIDKNYGAALEGLATIAYQQGDVKALFQCLAKQVKYFDGGGGSGPSAEFASLCGGVMNQEAMNNAGSQQDPTTNTTFDNGNSSDQYTQEVPPGADEEPIYYPSMKPIFVSDVKEVSQTMAQWVPMKQKIVDGLKAITQQTINFQKNLSPLNPPPSNDAEGNRIISANYEKFFNLFYNTHVLFEQRVKWFSDKCHKELSDLEKKIMPDGMNHVQQFYAALRKCSNDECTNQVKCVWIPRLHGEGNSDLSALGKIWNQYYQQLIEQCEWYKNASSPFIQRIHKPDWNEYVNLIRENDVRQSILQFYEMWYDAVMAVQVTTIPQAIQEQVPTCKVELRSMSDGAADAFSHKPKQLKTFAGPCYTESFSLSLGFIDYEDNCDHTKIGVKVGPGEAFVQKVYSKKFKEDDYFRTGLTINASTGFEYKDGTGEIGKYEGMTGKVSGNLGVKATMFIDYGQDGNVMDKGVDVDMSAELSGNVKTNIDKIDQSNPLKFKYGLDASFTVEVESKGWVVKNAQVSK